MDKANVEEEDERKKLESRLIGTVAKCPKCKPSEDWLGNYSPIEKIRVSGLWLTQHLKANEITDKDMEIIEILVKKTKSILSVLS